MGVRANLLLASALTMGCAGSSDATTGAAMDAASGTSAAGTTSGGVETITATTGISGTGGVDASSSSSGDETSEGSTSSSGGGSESTSTSSSTGEGSTSSTTGEGSSESTTGTGGETGGCDLMTPDTTCEEAPSLGDVSGDDGSEVSQSGAGSTWLLVHVQETNGSIFEEDLSYTVELESPPGADYDLFVYEGPQDGEPDCTVMPTPGVPTDGVESVSASWDDDQGIGGEDDSLWLAIEIVHVTGDDCDAQWTLTVVGGA